MPGLLPPAQLRLTWFPLGALSQAPTPHRVNGSDQSVRPQLSLSGQCGSPRLVWVWAGLCLTASACPHPGHGTSAASGAQTPLQEQHTTDWGREALRAPDRQREVTLDGTLLTPRTRGQGRPVPSLPPLGGTREPHGGREASLGRQPLQHTVQGELWPGQ